jgi:virginiamycin B lyase
MGMTRTRIFVVILLVMAAIIIPPSLSRAQTSLPAALAGHVTSQEEGPMEGVLVSAKRTDSTIKVTIATDGQGVYSFPKNRLEPGQYTITIRAVGYDLEGLGNVNVTANQPASLDLKLVKTKDLAAQLTNAEWLMSMPGTREQKIPLMNCVQCHTLERIVRSHHTAAEFRQVMQRMGSYMRASQPGGLIMISPYKRKPLGQQEEQFGIPSADYLASINLSTVSEWKYPLKTMPRIKGKGTKVIITTYDLPRPHIVVHDMTVGSGGMMWYCDNAQQFIGRVDTETGKAMEFPVPVLKPDMPTGCRTMEFDPDGNIWVGMKDQSGTGKFDLKTMKFVQTWSLPKPPVDEPQRVENVQSAHMNVDGKVWAQWSESRIQRLDVRSGKWDESIDVFKDAPPVAHRHDLYDIYSDSQNNLWLTDYGSQLVGKVDAKTLKITYWSTPTTDSGPRRAHFDTQDRLWFGEFRGNKIGMFDPKTEKFQEWEIPDAYAGPYDAILDKNGYAWTGGMTTDRVTHLNPKTGELVEYMLPDETNVRKVDVDNSASPISFWIGSTHHSALVKVEPLE